MGSSRIAIQREVVDGFVWSAMPVRVVAASQGELVLYRARGTVCYWPSHPRGTPAAPATVTQRPEPWEHGFEACVTVVEPAADRSVSLLWRNDWSFVAWYVDYIRPYRETPIGWDFTDLHLDVVVDANGNARVKDEDEFASAVEHGHITDGEAARASSWVDEVLADATNRVGIFGDKSWLDWRPDPQWSMPAIRYALGARLTSTPTRETEILNLDDWIDIV